jgi:UDP-N-acetyl-2-amino-2-deoxyglucuronate dehydrogenase
MILIRIFGDVKENKVVQHTQTTASGYLELEKATVNWMLSIVVNTLPVEVKAAGKRTFKGLIIDGDSFEFSDGITELHTQSYTEIISGKGFLFVKQEKR